MRYSIIKESRVIVEYEGRLVHLDALSSYSLGTGFTEYKTTRKTIHNRLNYAHSHITAKDTSYISLVVYPTKSRLENVFLELLGLDKEENRLVLGREQRNIEPKMCTLYIVFKDATSLKFSKTLVNSVDFTLDTELLKLTIGLEAGSFEEYRTPTFSNAVQDTDVTYSPFMVRYNNNILPGVKNGAISFQQQCEWRNDRSVFDAGNIHENSRAIIKEMNVSATLTCNFIATTSSRVAFSVDPEYSIPIEFMMYNIRFDLPSNLIMKRLNTDALLTLEMDITPSEHSEPVSIIFLEK